MEFHIPQEFSRDRRPAVGYTHVVHDMDMADHPLASKIPSGTKSDRPVIVGDPDEFAELSCGPGCPQSLDDYLNFDRPVLGVRIVSFTDATMVTLHWLHIACDALGMKAVLQNWILMMQGREDEVPMLHGFEQDPLQELGRHPTEPHVLADSVMSTGSSLLYGLRNGYSLVFGPKEGRMVCIPAAFWKKLRTDALAELVAAGVEKPFLTENDVLTAWWTRLALTRLAPETPVTIMMAMSARRALEKDLLPPDKLYVSNCLAFMNLLMPQKDLYQSLGTLAGQIRRGINEQGTREQIEAYEGLVRAAAYPLPLFMGNGSTHQISYSNWTKADLFKMDFSVAAVKPRHEPLLPSFTSHAQIPFKCPEAFIIMGKDSHDNYWLQGYRVAGQWANLEKDLAEAT